ILDDVEDPPGQPSLRSVPPSPSIRVPLRRADIHGRHDRREAFHKSLSRRLERVQMGSWCSESSRVVCASLCDLKSLISSFFLHPPARRFPLLRRQTLAAEDVDHLPHLRQVLRGESCVDAFGANLQENYPRYYPSDL